MDPKEQLLLKEYWPIILQSVNCEHFKLLVEIYDRSQSYLNLLEKLSNVAVNNLRVSFMHFFHAHSPPAQYGIDKLHYEIKSLINELPKNDSRAEWLYKKLKIYVTGIQYVQRIGKIEAKIIDTFVKNGLSFAEEKYQDSIYEIFQKFHKYYSVTRWQHGEAYGPASEKYMLKKVRSFTIKKVAYCNTEQVYSCSLAPIIHIRDMQQLATADHPNPMSADALPIITSTRDRNTLRAFR